MDTDAETKRFKWLLIAGILFVVSAFFSWSELKYALFGKQVEARLVKVVDTTDPGRRGREVMAVHYEFADSDGTTRNETDRLPATWDRPSGQTIPIQYLSGSPDSSRVVGNTRRVWILIFLGSLVFFGFKVFQIYREFKS